MTVKVMPMGRKSGDVTDNNVWGTLSTISVHLNGQAWGQPKSFVDGSLTNSTGNFYFYDSEMDTSLQDIAANSNVSFSLSAAALGLCPPLLLDPESPLCARLVVSGQFLPVDDAQELTFATLALFERHPTMKNWPEDHSWGVYKIVLTDIWLIDVFGGATDVSVDEYYAVNLNKRDDEEEEGDGKRYTNWK
eukprot:gene30991-38300_t